MEKSQVKDGDTGRFIREHMVEEWQPVTIRQPLAEIGRASCRERV